MVMGSGERRAENGERKAEIWRRVGIVFDTRGCVGLPLPTLYVWVLFSIPVVMWDFYCEIPSLYVSGIVFDTRDCRGYICVWVKQRLSAKATLRRKKSAEGEAKGHRCE